MNSHTPFRLISRWTRLLHAAAFTGIALLSAFVAAPAAAQSRADYPAPSFSGVTAPAVIFYVAASVNYRLPPVANADDVYNVTYSVTPALPSDFSLDSSTATITTRQAISPSALAQTTYTLRATDGFSRTADLAFTLAVINEPGLEKIEITSSPGADRTYGKVAPFGSNDNITVRVSFTHDLISVRGSDACLTIRIGSNNRRVCNPGHTDRSRTLDFSYAVQASDWDHDGISFPTNPMGAGRHSSLQWRRGPVSDPSEYVNRNFASTPDDANHKVRGQQTTPSFGSTPSYSWVRGNAVSQVLPAATGGEGGVTYAIEGNLPAGLSFAAATRTISGTPTATQGATSYTMVATDGDGDSGRLTFSIEIEEIVVSSISSPSVAEGAAGATATLEYDVTLNRAPGRQVTVDWAAAANPGTATSGTDYTAITGGTLTFAAAQTSRTFEVTVTGDALDEPDETVQVALSNPSGAVLGSAVTGVGTITDDDATPTLLLALSEPDAGNPDTINESRAGNATTVTASLDGGTSGEAITVTVSATPVYAALADDDGYSLSAARTLTIAAGATASTGTVTVTALDDAIDSAAKTATVGGTVAGGHGLVAAPSGVTLTIADDDAQPRSTLVLTPASISESGGVTTVTATLSNPSANAVTVAVTAAAVSPAVAGDFALSSAATLVIAAGQTASSGTVTVTAVGNATDSADKSVTVSGSASGTPGAADPPDATLTIRDDDGAPTVSLVLSSSSVSESGGVVTVTAALNGTSSEAVTVTVATAEVASSGAVPDDFALSAATTLTIAANAMTSTGTVTITARDNAVDSPHKRVTVSGTASGGNGIADPASLTLTLADDEATPTTRLALSSASIAEAGGVSTVTATLSGVSSEATTVTVSASPGAGTDFTLTGTTLTIEAGDTTSTGAVTVTAEPDTTDSADKRVAVSGAASGGNGAESPSDATLTIVDDDALPTLSLSLSASTIDESGSGNVATVTAALSHPSGEAVEVTVSLSPTLPAVAGDFSLSANTMLTIAAGSTESAGDVTITAVDDPADAPDKETTVWGTATGGRGVTDPARGLTLIVADGDDAPGVTLSVSPTSISENRNAATVTATLTHPSSAATTVTVTGVSGFYTVGSDATIVIAAGQTANASDTALVVAVNDDVHQGSGGRSTTVTGTASNSQGAGSVTGAPLTLTDNEDLPEVTLVLSPTSISENGEVSTVTATLSRASSEAVTVTVDAAAGTGAVADDFALSAARTLTIASGDTTSAGAVTVTANDNATDAPNKQVTVSGTASGGNGVAAPPDATLTLTDDEDLPEVTLVLSEPDPTKPDTIPESGAGNASTVTATLSGASSEAVTVTVAATGVTATVGDDFMLSTDRTLTIAAEATTSTGTVTVTAVDDTTDEPDETVTVSATVSGGNNVAPPSSVTLTLTDDETLPTVTLALSSSSISEGGGVTTVTAALSGESSEAVTVAVSAAPLSGAVVADYALSANKALVIAARSTASTGTVTLTAVNNNVQASDKTVTVSGAASGGNGVSAPAGLTLTITDNDGDVPSDGTRWTNGVGGGNWDVTTTELLGKTTSQTIVFRGSSGVARFTDVWACATRTVIQDDSEVAEPSSPPCTKLADDIGSARSVTIPLTQAMIDNDGVVIAFALGLLNSGRREVRYINAEWVPIVALPKATLSLSPSSISESGGVSAVTATLDKAALSAATLTVSAPAGDFTLSAATTLTFATGETASTGMVTITATDNATDEPDKRVTVSASASGDVRAPPDATLTITDDEAAPTVTLALSASSIAENGGESTVTATLSHPSSAATTVTVTGVSGFYTAGSDATIVITAGETANAADVATVAAVDDDVHQGGAARSTTVTATVANDQGAGSVTGAPLTLTDDDAAPGVTLTVSPASISESGGVSTVTATLSHPSSAATTVTVTAVADFYTVGSDATIVIAAGETANATDTVAIAAADNAKDEPDRTVTVTATAANDQGTTGSVTGATLTLEDDDAAPGVTLAVSPSSISENGGVATVSATLTHPSSAATTVTVMAALGFYTVGSDATIVIAAGETANAADTALVTAGDDAAHSGGRSTTVTATAANDQGVGSVTGAALTLTDDETPPTVALVLSPASISETGGVSTVTATLSVRSSEAVTVTVDAAAGTGAIAADFDLSTARTLTIVAGQTASTGAVTVTANGNAVDAPDKSVTVSGTVSGGNGVAAPPDVTLTLTDDEAFPRVALVLSSASISETGGVATVTATLSVASSEAVTVTVSTTPISGSDFTLSTANTLTIASGDTTSTGAVTVTAEHDTTDEPDETVTVSATVSGGNNVAAPSSVTLTLTDDETLPTVTLALSSSSISEGSGVTTVTAALSGVSSEAVTVTVTAAPSSGAVVADYALSTNKTLTIEAGSTASTGTVTLTAVNNNVQASDKTVTVSGTASGGNGVSAPAGLTLTITDNDGSVPTGSDTTWRNVGQPQTNWDVTTMSLVAETTSQTISFTGSYLPLVTDVWACANKQVTQLAHTGIAGPSNTECTKLANDIGSARSVTIGITQPMIDNDGIVILFTREWQDGVIYYNTEWVPIVAPPKATLSLSPSSISENGGVSTVTATLDKAASAATTITVSAAAVSPALPADFTLSPANTLTIATGGTTSTGMVTLTAVDNAADAPDKTVTVSATASGDVKAPPDATLTVTDDEGGLTVVESGGSTATTEAGGTDSFTVRLTSNPSQTVNVLVTSQDTSECEVSADGGATYGVSGTVAMVPTGGDASAVAASLWNSPHTVTVRGKDDDVDDGNQICRVTVDPGETGAGNLPYNRVVTQTVSATNEDDDVAGLTVSAVTGQATEAGGTATFTAKLATRPTAAVTVTVTGGDASEGTVSPSSLTFAPGVWNTAQTVTVTGVDDDVDDGDVTWNVVLNPDSGPAGDPHYRSDIAVPNANVRVSTTDDDTAGVTFTPTALTVTEQDAAGATFAVVLDSEPPPGTTSVRLGRSDAEIDLNGVRTYPYNLSFDPTNWSTAQTVTVTASADSDVRNDTKEIRYTVAGYAGGVTNEVAVTVTVIDDDKPVVSLSLSESSISENGGVATVTAALDRRATEATTVTVSAAPVAPAAAGDFTLSGTTLTIAAGSTTSTGTVTVTATDNATDAPDKSVTVSATSAGGNGATAPSSVTLTLTDDDAAPEVTLALSPASISENGGAATVSATLSHPSSAATTVTVTEETGFYTVGSDTVIVIAAGETAAASDTATIEAVNNTTDAPDRAGTVTATVSNDRATTDGTTLAVTGGALTVTDDDDAPNAALSLNPASVTENGGVSTVSATLTHPSSEPTTVTVTPVSGAYTVGSDATIVIAAGETANGTDTAAVAAVDNAKDEPDRTATVTATLTNSQGAGTVSGATLTLEDDDTAPGVTLSVASSSIPESGGSTTVSAVLSGASSAVTTVTVTPVPGVYTVDSGAAGTIVIAAGETTNATDSVTITAVNNDVDAADNAVTVMGTATNSQAAANSETMTVTGATLTITDDDTAGFSVSPATTTSSRLRTTEDGGTAAFEVELGSEPTGNVVLDVVSSAPTEGTVSVSSLTFTAMTWSTAQTVTLTGVDDAPANSVDGDQDYTVTLTVNTTSTADATYDALSAVTVYAVNADNEYGLDVGSVTGQATEAGGTAAFTVALMTRPLQAVTVTVTSLDASEGTVSPSSLTFTDSDWNTTQAVTVTGADDAIDDGDVTWDVRLAPSSGDANYDGLSNVDVSVTTTDDDDAPGVVLALSPSSISESGGEATVTATLSHPSGAATTVTVTEETGFYTVGSDAAGTIVIAAGETAAASDTATVAAVDNDTDAPDRAGTVTATITNDRATADGMNLAVTGASLTVTDDDAAPGATLALSASSIGESGTSNVSTVTATLTRPSSAATTVTVTASPGAGTDFTLAGTTLTIAAGDTTSSGTVTITADDDDTDSPDKSVTVSGTMDNSQGTGAVTGTTLTITDDEAAPGATLALSASSIDESGTSNVSTVTATLTHPSSAATTVTVTASPGAGTDFTLAGTKLTIAAGDTTSSGTVTITADDDDTDSPDKSVTVSGTMDNSQGTGAVTGATLTITDDDAAPTVTLSVSPSSISENGGEATVTATLSRASGAATTVTVTPVPGLYTAVSDAVIVIAAGETANATDTATIEAVDNTTDEPDRAGTVTATVSNDVGAGSVSGAALTVTDDEDPPEVALVLSSASISESSGVSTVTATLSHPSSEAVTVTVEAAEGTGAEAADFTLSGTTTLTIAAGDTTSSGAVTVTANGNTVDSPDKEVTVSGTVSGGNGVAAPSRRTLTLTDDELLPTVSLSLSEPDPTKADTIPESGAGSVSTVTATLSGASSETVTVTVAATGVTAVVGDDFTLSGTTTLTIAAGATTSAGTVAVTAVDDTTAEADETVTVSGTVSGGNGVAAPSSVTLTIADDETLPTVTLVLSPTSISEDGGVSTVTATLSGVSSEAVTVTVGAAAGTGAVADDFDLSTARTVTIAAGSTTSAGVVTVTAKGNMVDSPDKEVTVSGTVSGGNNVAAPSSVMLTLTDDDTAGFSVSPPTTTSLLLRTTEGGRTATFTVELGSEPTGNVVLAVASGNTSEGTVSPASLTFTDSTWSTAQTVTLTGVDDAPDNPADGDQDYTVTLTVNQPSTADAIYDALSAVTVHAVNADNEYGLDVGEVTGQATEAGGTATFTVELVTRPSAAVTVTVTSRDTSEGAPSPSSSSSSLTFTDSDWNVAQTVTVFGADDAIDDGEVTWAMRLDPSSGDANYDGLSNVDVLVTTTDDDAAPGVVLAVSPSSIVEDGGTATVTAALSHPSGAATTVTVTPVPGFYTVGSDAVIVIAAGETANATDTATVAAVDNTTDAPDRAGTVTATITNDRATADGTTMAVTGGALTVTDDDAAPNAALSLNPASVSENGGASAVSATLTHPSSEPTTVTVTPVSGAYTVGSDATIVIAAGSTANATDTAAITAVDNAKDEPDRTATVTATLTNGQGAGTASGATLTLEDDDAAPGVTLSVSPESISENGGSTTVSATLTHPSSAETTVTVTVTGGSGSYTVGSGAAGTIVIAAGETANATDTATITAVDNDVDAADNVVTVTGTAENAQATAESETMTVTGASLTITDDDTAGFSVSPATSASSRLRTTEDGGTAAFEVELGSEPTGDVVLDVASSDTTEGTVSVSSLTFTDSTWSTAQTVTLTGVDDAPTNPADGAQDYTVTLTVNTVSTADATYDALSVVRVYAVNADNDATADVNEDGLVDEDDVLVMYYAYTAPGLLNRSRLRRLVLRPLLGRGSSSTKLTDTDSDYMTMLSNANDWQNNPSAGGDVNQDGLVDEDDVLVMYYAYTAPGLLNRSRLRRLVLRPLLGRGSSSTKLTDTDSDYMTMLSNANALSTSP